ncbi:MAG: CHAT domain-containing protein [Capsulimonadaceae bacterium]|nr:CHAT domain-containing protein [Capsulimonadaceae bacterium]
MMRRSLTMIITVIMLSLMLTNSTDKPAPAAQPADAHLLYMQASAAERDGNLPAAFRLYNRAASLDRSDVIYVLGEASCLTKLRRYSQADQILQRALGRFPRGLDRDQVSLSLAGNDRVWSTAMESSAQLSRAAALLQRCYAIDLKLAQPTLIEDCVAIADLNVRSGRYSDARRWYTKAHQTAHGIQDSAKEAIALNDLGILLWRLGDYDNSLASLRRADKLCQEAGPRAPGDAVLNSLGLVLRSSGNYGDAAKDFATAHKLAAAARHSSIAAAATANLGATYHATGLYAKAVTTYSAALAEFQAQKDVDGQATVLGNIGYARFYQGRLAEARTSLTRSLTLRRASRDLIGEQAALSDLGRLDADAGSFSASRREIQEAYRLAGVLHDPAGMGICLTDLASLDLRMGAARQAMKAGYRAILALKTAPDPTLAARAESVLMEVARAAGSPDAAVFWGKRAVGRYEAIREGLSGFSYDARNAFCSAHAQTYRTLANILIDQGRINEAISVLALLKGEELDEFDRDGQVLVRGQRPPVRGGEVLVRGQRPPVRDGIVLVRGQKPPIREDKRIASNAQLTGIQRIVELTSPERVALALTESAASEDAITQAMCRAFPPASQRSHPSTAKESLLPTPKRPGVARIWTLVTPDGVRIIAATGGRRIIASTAIRAEDLNRDVFRLRQALEDPSQDPRPAAQKIYNIVLPPRVAALLAAARVTATIWSLDGVLRYVPMAGLYDGSKYLAERWSTAIASPVKVRKTVEEGHGTLAMGVSKQHVVEEPQTGNLLDFPALPEVPEELKAVTANTNESHVRLLDEQFTLGAARTALQNGFGIVHIATHFHLHAADASRSCLLLGDGTLLTLAGIGRIPDLFRGVDLLTLSACQTGAPETDQDGKEVDGVAGIASRAGARSLLATLWSVEDPSVRAFMKRFYEARTNERLPVQEALREAQVGLIHGGLSGNESREPRYWAPFVVYIQEN